MLLFGKSDQGKRFLPSNKNRRGFLRSPFAPMLSLLCSTALRISPGLTVSVVLLNMSDRSPRGRMETPFPPAMPFLHSSRLFGSIQCEEPKSRLLELVMLVPPVLIGVQRQNLVTSCYWIFHAPRTCHVARLSI